MKFYGMTMTFSTVGEQQYKTIGEYWDFFSGIFGRENIRGLGYGWKNGTSIEYSIGTTDNSLKFNIDEIKVKYPDSEFKVLELPDTGWKSYDGKTEDIGSMYTEIYRDGPLLYEIESFNDNGDCHLEICR